MKTFDTISSYMNILFRKNKNMRQILICCLFLLRILIVRKIIFYLSPLHKEIQETALVELFGVNITSSDEPTSYNWNKNRTSGSRDGQSWKLARLNGAEGTKNRVLERFARSSLFSDEKLCGAKSFIHRAPL